MTHIVASKETGAKERDFGQGRGGDEGGGKTSRVTWGITPGKEGLVTVQDNKLLLKAVHRATQVLRFYHLSARPQVWEAHSVRAWAAVGDASTVHRYGRGATSRCASA
eukprot:2634484-Pleurochrysis_carterae.AAC.1